MIDTSGGPRVPEGNVANPGPILNDALNVNKHQEVYGEDPTNLDPLKFKYLKGRWGGFSVAGATEDLTDDATNYIVVERSTGTLTVATTNTNWNNSASYARVKRIVLASGERTDDEDYRAGPGGVHGQSDAGGGGTSTVVTESGTALTADDANAGNYTRFTNAGAKTYTFDSAETYAVGDEYHGRNVGAGDLTLTEAGSFTLNAPAGGSLVVPQGGTFTVKIVASDEADLIGVTVEAP